MARAMVYSQKFEQDMVNSKKDREDWWLKATEIQKFGQDMIYSENLYTAA